MSLEAAEQFRSELAQEGPLHAELTELFRTRGTVNVTQFANDHGFDVTASEITEAWNTSRELSDAELELVSGGGQASNCYNPGSCQKA